MKNYHWGIVGDDSLIAKFLHKEAQIFHKDEKTTTDSTKKTPLAELWYGVHPSGPSYILAADQEIRLDEFLHKEASMVGCIDQYAKHHKTLPFLFKLLAVAQPLSLQAHPDKKLAEELHLRDPEHYPDSNHKPELAIAITQFEILCDFRPHKEILSFIKSLAPLQSIVGQTNYEAYAAAVSGGNIENCRTALGSCYQALMKTNSDKIRAETEKLLNLHDIHSETKELIHVTQKLTKLYPGDPGVLAPFFLNYIKLKPGQAVYLKANKLHAYLQGQCVECMACSDNVIRAGLTTKYRDVDTLLKMLDYATPNKRSDVLYIGKKCVKDPAVETYAPTEDFIVDKIVITEHHALMGQYNISAIASASFFVVLGGKATVRNFFKYEREQRLELGTAGFIPPKTSLKLYDIYGTVTIYRAHC